MSGLPSWARVGAKVVCVDASGRGASQLSEGDVYVVSWCGLSDRLRAPMIGIAGTTDRAGNEGQWKVSRFRPLVTIEDYIATHFSALLDVREPVEA